MSGLPSGPSNSLGVARAQIVLEVQAQAGIAAARQAGQQIQAAVNNIDKGSRTAQTGVKSLSSALTSLGGAVGIASGAFAAMKLAHFALEADSVATAYKRQSVAALSLAGSQGKLNELLSVYDRVTGGAIDKATALGNVTKLQAIGFADTAGELERFATAARGISVAMGVDQDYVISQLTLAIANQSTRRLDQIGLGVSEVEAKIKELKAADSSLTTEMAYQNAVLGIATTKYGALAKSTVAQATGAEKAAKAWKDFKLEFGEALGPVTGGVMQGAADQISGISDLLKGVADDARTAGKALQGMGGPNVGLGGALSGVMNFDPVAYIREKFSPANQIRGQMAGAENIRSGLEAGLVQIKSDIASGARTGPQVEADLARQESLLKDVNAQLGVFRAQLQLNYAGSTAGANNFAQNFSRPSAAAPGFTDAQQADIVAHEEGIRQIERSAAADRLSATEQYESQRSETIYSYEQGIAREEQDFGISRQRQAADLAATIARIGLDSSRQAAKWAEDLADSIAKMQADSGKRVAEAQEDTNKRIAEINEQYAKSRAKAERDHNETLLEAAGNLDAKAIFEEQRSYAKSSQDAKEAHDDAIDKAKEGLAERTQKEAENLQERIAQAQEANQKQLQQAKEADDLRIQDAKDALAKQQQQEDEDRALRLQRGAEDQAHQLAQMDIAQGERLAQIDRHAAEERTQLDEEFLKQLNDDGLRNNKWLLQQTELKRLALLNFDDWWKEINKRFIDAQVGPTSAQKKQSFIDLDKVKGWASGGAITTNQIARLHAGEYVMSKSMVDRMGGYGGIQQMQATGGRSTSIGDISFSIYPLPGQNAGDIAQAVRGEMMQLFKGLS